jgi:hypothetical protein
VVVAGSPTTEEPAPVVPWVAAGAALGLHEGIASSEAPYEPPKGCARWPSALWLQSTLGVLVQGRCKATNLCDYCAVMAGIENCEVLWHDALSNSTPTIWTVLGTRSTSTNMADFRIARQRVMEEARKAFPDAEAATLIEYTTGYGRNAGGARRPHLNWTWKNVDDAEKLHAVTLKPWLAQVDATAQAHSFERCVRSINEMGGLARYLANHLTKESQRPPTGFRGHRFRTTRGYLAEPLPAAREQARQALRFRRELWKARQAGLDGQEAEDAAQRALYEANELAWELVRVQRIPTAFDNDDQPTDWGEIIVPVRR